MTTIKVSLAEAEKLVKEMDWTESDALTDEDIARQIASNPDAAPELDSEWFARSAAMNGAKVVRPGRPKLERPKISVTLRLDADVVERFRASGRGWQSRINELLRERLPE
jgi:uncharacterized protein (DUF4415 family)